MILFQKSININFEEGIRTATLETRHTRALMCSQSFHTAEEVYIKWTKNSTEDLYTERFRKPISRKQGRWTQRPHRK